MGWVIGIAVLGVGGFIAYKIYTSSSSSPLDKAENLAKGAVSTTEDLLKKDPISVVSVGKDVYTGGKDAVQEVESWF